MMRINQISNLINKQKIVVDIGSDHAFLAIKLLQLKKAKLVINIEKNILPLNNTICNLKKIGLINKTINLFNDGLKDFCKLIKLDKLTTVTISGMGANNMINILNSKDHILKVQSYILLPNNNAQEIRKWSMLNSYNIDYESVIIENNEFYFLFKLIKNNSNQQIKLSELEIQYGKINITQMSKNFVLYLKQQKEYITKNKLHLLNSDYDKKLADINLLLKGQYDN